MIRNKSRKLASRVFFTRKGSKLVLIICAMGAPSALSFGSEGGFRVGNYTDLGPDAKTIVIDAGSYEGVAPGDIFRVYRAGNNGGSPGVSIETGQARALVVYEHKLVAEITQNATPLSTRFYPRFPEIMSGDIAIRERLEIKPNLTLSPEINLPLVSLFEDPKASPQTFELTENGRTILAKESDRLAGLRAGMLMIIGHTDAKGPAETNQIESYQRAMVVRQFLIDQLGFSSDRVVAIGKGEDDLPEETLTPGFADRARRIVLKVVAVP